MWFLVISSHWVLCHCTFVHSIAALSNCPRSLFTQYFTFLSFVFAQLAIVSHIFVTLRPHINPFVSVVSCEDEVNRLEHDCII